MEKVEPLETSLQHSLAMHMNIKLDSQNSKIHKVAIKEHRTEFQDRWSNVLDLFEPKNLDYVNFEEPISTLETSRG